VIQHPFLLDGTHGKLRCGLDARLDVQLLGAPRITALAQASLAEVVCKLGAHGVDAELTLMLSLPELRPGFGARELEGVAQAVRAELPSQIRAETQTVAEGHAGALASFERAAKLIVSDPARLVILGGVDSYLDAATIDWLASESRISCEGARSGFLPGEAAAMIVLASAEAREKLGLPSLGRISAAAQAREKRDPNIGAGLLGEGLSEVIAAVAAEHIEHAGYVDDVYCDLNGERSRTTDWSFAVLRHGSWFRNATRYRSAVSACGDVGAATGALNVVLAVRAWQRGLASGKRALVCGSSWSGLRAAALLRSADT
jgi:3-oxoacyl-[acyl-carrier-protein] synthase-1